ncbi:hypothetical protein SOVF_159840 [Spinacia oleracea]|nr:hypothetical protein SOVF_159840 [Spinacia oleracea]
MAMIRKCGVSSSPTRKPLLHHLGRRRMTLGMLLLSPIDSDWKPHPRRSMLRQGITKNKVEEIGKNTLKDLMSSSKNLFDNNNTMVDDDDDDKVIMFQEKKSNDILAPQMRGGGHGNRRVRQGINRAGIASSAGLRIRFFKRGWRPVLGAIPEGYPSDAPPHLFPH